MQVKDLVPGLNDVTISGRVLLSWPPQDFQRKDGTPGRVMRIMLVDRSGRARCAVWDRHVDVLSRAGDLQGKVLRVGHAYTRQGLSGDTEVHAGERSSIEIDPEDMPNSDLPEFGELFTPLANLAIGSNQVNAVGLVQSEPRHYTFNKDERTGSVLRVLIGDESGSMALVAWNERAEELRELKTGAILRALNARVRQDRNGGPELHVESRSQVQVLGTAPPYLKLPVTKTYKITELPSRGSVNLTAAILMIGAAQEIKRPSGETTRVARLLISDGTGIISLSLWDDKADVAASLREGDVIEIAAASIRERNGEVMLSLGRSGKLQKSMTESVYVREATKLGAIQQSKGLVIVEGNITDTPMARQIVTEKGENVSLASFTLRDDTAARRVTLWRDQAASAEKLKPGTRVRIEGVRVRTGLTGDFELSSIPLTRLQVLEEKEKERPAWEDIRHVIALEPGLKTWVKGVIIDFQSDPKVGLLCESCGSGLAFAGGQLVCQKCKLPRSGRVVLSSSLKLDDGTGVVNAKLIQVDASKLSVLDRRVVESELSETNSAEAVLREEQKTALNGKEVELHGIVESSSKGGLEFIVDKIMLASPS